MTKATGLPSTTMSTGIVEGLKAVNARKVAVATAYNEDVSNRLKVFLEESGFEVVSVKGLGIVSLRRSRSGNARRVTQLQRERVRGRAQSRSAGDFLRRL